MSPDTCIRCNNAAPELGRWLCKACAAVLDNLAEPRPEDQGKPVSRRVGPKLHVYKQRTLIPRKP